jgi:hypothetical protein
MLLKNTSQHNKHTILRQIQIIKEQQRTTQCYHMTLLTCCASVPTVPYLMTQLLLAGLITLCIHSGVVATEEQVERLHQGLLPLPPCLPPSLPPFSSPSLPPSLLPSPVIPFPLWRAIASLKIFWDLRMLVGEF